MKTLQQISAENKPRTDVIESTLIPKRKEEEKEEEMEMKNLWQVAAMSAGCYQVYRIIDPSKPDHTGNREWGDVYDSEEEAEKAAMWLNASVEALENMISAYIHTAYKDKAWPPAKADFVRTADMLRDCNKKITPVSNDEFWGIVDRLWDSWN